MKSPKSNQITLKTYLAKDGVSQGSLAKKLGVVQSAVSQWVQDERNIFIEVLGNGKIRAWEIRQVPWKGKFKASA